MGPRHHGEFAGTPYGERAASAGRGIARGEMAPDDQLPNMNEARARRMVRDLVQDQGDATAEGGAGMPVPRVIARAVAASMVLAVLAMLHFSGDAVRVGAERNSSQNPSMIVQHADRQGSLLGMQRNSTIGIPLAVAAVVSSSLCAAPPGYVLVADSQAQFSGEQGRDGWSYLYDVGNASAIQPLPYVTTNFGVDIWCTREIAGDGGSHCMIKSDWFHANDGYDCNTPQPGLQRPIRQWGAAQPAMLAIDINAVPSFNSGGMRLELLVDGVVMKSWTSIYGSIPSIAEQLDVGVARSIALRLDPLVGCGSDGCLTSLQVFAADCNANDIADYLEIAGNPSLDRDHDGALDSCQCAAHPEICCPADLTRDGQVNGADLGAVLAFWGPNPAYPQADLNADGRVDGADLGALLAGWGPCGQ